MQIEKLIPHQIVLLRPYSMGNIALVAILTIVFSTGVFIPELNALIAILLAISYWGCSLYFAEFLHKKVDYREKMYSNHFSIGLYIFFILVSLFFNPHSITIFIVVLFFIWLYASKSKGHRFSHIMFLFRPAPEIGIIYSTAALYQISFFSENLVLLSLIVYLLSISRNLIGDIRDINHDKYTLPVKIGKNNTYLLSLLFGILLVLLTIQIKQNFAILPLIFILILIALRVNAYALHRIYIFASGLYLCFLLASYTINPSLLIGIILINFILYFTYNLIPRKINLVQPIWL